MLQGRFFAHPSSKASLRQFHGDRHHCLRGAKYNTDGEKQVIEYLDYFGLTVGYMLSFCFNKKKISGVSEIRIGDKLLYEGIV